MALVLEPHGGLLSRQRGTGLPVPIAWQRVCAALLVRGGIPVVSRRDLKTLNAIFRKLDGKSDFRPEITDHHEIDRYRTYFQT